MRILCITLGQYPNNDAASQRLHLLASLLNKAGHEVEVVSRNKTNNSGTNDFVYYKSVYSHPKSKLGSFIDVFTVFPKRVKEEINRYKPDAILLISSPSSFAKWLYKHKQEFFLFHDSVEWYSKEEYSHPALSLEYRKKQKWMKNILPLNFDIIAISSYLYEYFSTCGNRCVLIPSICDCDSIKYTTSFCDDPISITYAGSPGKKDRFQEIIGALMLLSEDDKKRVQLQIIGASREQIAENAGVSLETITNLGNTLKFVGRVSRQEVYDYLAKSDFTILIRPEEAVYAKAGFPTKVPESLAAGTPVISNLTSDLKVYLNSDNAVIVNSCTVEAVLNALHEVLSLSPEKIVEMKKCARRTAENSFNYLIYEKTLDDFIKGGSHGTV